jgi:WhiB family redox-sensing transcriptional regulator
MLAGDIATVDDFVRRPPFQALAACKGMDPALFFVGHGADSYDEARAICAECAVSEACLAYALADSELHGMWGGTTPRERRAMRRAGGCSNCGTTEGLRLGRCRPCRTHVARYGLERPAGLVALDAEALRSVG